MSQRRKTAARSTTPAERMNGRQGVTERLMNIFLATAFKNDAPFYHCHSAAVRHTAKGVHAKVSEKAAQKPGFLEKPGFS